MKKNKIFNIISGLGVIIASVALVVAIALTVSAGTQDTKVLGTADRDGERPNFNQP